MSEPDKNSSFCLLAFARAGLSLCQKQQRFPLLSARCPVRAQLGLLLGEVLNSHTQHKPEPSTMR